MVVAIEVVLNRNLIKERKKKSLSKAQDMTVLSPSYTAPTAAAAATAILTCWCGFGGHWTRHNAGSGCFVHVVY